VDDADLGGGEEETGEGGFGFHGTGEAVGGDTLADEIVLEGGDSACYGYFGGCGEGGRRCGCGGGEGGDCGGTGEGLFGGGAPDAEVGDGTVHVFGGTSER